MKLSERIVFKFKNAINGIKTSMVEDRSIKVQVGFMVLAILISLLLKINTIDLIIVIIVSALVVALEFINSSIELLSDFSTDNKYSEVIKKVKDLSAAAVLVVSISALVVGIIIFSKYIF
ncbi:MAG TPA: diacylglycerol kinase family protein [Erysipelotrichaceae bacterium]|nr:diacylglycerol kinase family protein [Erysipelotrichaceae bacterium]